MTEQTPLPEPTPIKDLLTPEVHPVTGDLHDTERAAAVERVALDTEAAALDQQYQEDLQDGRDHVLSDDGLKRTGETMRANVQARTEQMRRDGMLPPE